MRATTGPMANRSSRWLGGLGVGLVNVLVLVGCADVAPPEQQAAAPPQQQAPPAAVPPMQVAPAQNPLPAAPAAVPESAVNPPPAEPPQQAEAAKQPEPPANAPEQVKPRRVIGKTTRDVRDAQKEEAKGAQRVQPKITGQDPYTISGSAYNAIVSRTEQLQIKHTIDIYYNLNGRYPKDLQEFMTEIIKKNGIRLAQLPYYQEYGYDAVKHELVILEYPDRKK